MLYSTVWLIIQYESKKYLRRVNFQFPNLSILQIFEFLNNFWGNFEKILENFCKYRSEWRWKVKFMRNYGCLTQKYLHNWVKCPVKYLNEGESIWQSVEQDTQILIFIIFSSCAILKEFHDKTFHQNFFQNFLSEIPPEEDRNQWMK